MKVLLAKLATIVQTKAAVVVLGAVVVAGGGTAAAVAATHGQLPLVGGIANTATHDTHSNGASQNDQGHAEGVLTSYANGKITIKEQDGTTMTFSVDANTSVNGAHANSLADLANVIGVNVQVQGDKQSDGSYLATKITVQGTDTGDQSGPTVLHGSIASISLLGLSFTVTPADGSAAVTVDITTSTQFAGRLTGAASLAVGDSVSVQGVKQADGTVVATRIEGGN